MTDNIKVFTVAHLPPQLENAWLQHLRDFDVANPGCHFEVMVDSPHSSFAEAIEAIRVNPGLTFTEFFARKS